MALCGIFIRPLNHPFKFLSTVPLSPAHKKTSHTSCSSPCNNVMIKLNEKFPVIGLGRRDVNFTLVGFLLLCEQSFFSNAFASPLLELERYTDSKEGFTILVPAAWSKVDKAGATVLFEDSSKKANNIGVVVNPTRISSLGEFGTPQFVADKLIQAERKKESTKEAEVISFSERSGNGGLQVYEFEYKVDSSRGGMKRVFSAAFATSKKLYLLNITYSDGVETPIDTDTRTILEQVMHSFDAVNST